MSRDDKVTIEEAKIVLRNFSGGPDRFNANPGRNFGVLLDPETAEAMAKDGWNVKYFNRKPDDDPDEPLQAFLKVQVSYKVRKPVIVVITSRGRRNYGEDLVDLLDAVDIKNVDLMISPFHWDVNGKTGIKAYLDSMYITIHENELERKYSDVEFDN